MSNNKITLEYIENFVIEKNWYKITTSINSTQSLNIRILLIHQYLQEKFKDKFILCNHSINTKEFDSRVVTLFFRKESETITIGDELLHNVPFSLLSKEEQIEWKRIDKILKTY